MSSQIVGDLDSPQYQLSLTDFKKFFFIVPKLEYKIYHELTSCVPNWKSSMLTKTTQVVSCYKAFQSIYSLNIKKKFSCKSKVDGSTEV